MLNRTAVSRRQVILKDIYSPKTNQDQEMSNVHYERQPVSEYFGELTFGLGEMRETLPRDAFGNLVKNLEKGERLTEETADAIALVVKEWAVIKGATHFCHWFQPMTGLTAEKHDAFISIQHSEHSELKVIERFTGGQLVQGEPDASSFPSGGMRSTFEARGYTAWDPSAPIFIVEGEKGNTLCLPSVFFGYHGQALDLKTPLLRSDHKLSEAACEFLKLIGDVDVKRINATVGAEQEYFLVDRQLAAMRPDLVMSGRTVLGAAPPRGQQLEDHYFGSIPTRVKNFMEDSEKELYRLGIPVKTRHNEVAPSQFEIAPIFENANISADHNTLTMETLRRVANRHGFMCLLHEKPFAELNGSGKHCNWSMSNDKGENLLEPGKTPHQNLRFLAVISVILSAVYRRSDFLRAAISSPGNDHRLGANEAPPAIISVFIGSMLSKIFDDLEQGSSSEGAEGQIISLGVSSLPTISKDYTDRNRTSPFAFTGNKFEFRAVGSAANIAFPMTILNAAVSEAFFEASVRLKKLVDSAGKGKRDEAVLDFIRQMVSENKAIRFEGNNYSDEWRKEAKERGLPILDSTVESMVVYTDTSRHDFLVKQNILTEDELQSRFNVSVERYVKTLLIEMGTLKEMTTTYVIPAVEHQLKQSLDVLDDALTDRLKPLLKQRIVELENLYSDVLTGLTDLGVALQGIGDSEPDVETMGLLKQKAIPVRDKMRVAIDQLENLVADEFWPLPKYREMLFTNMMS